MIIELFRNKATTSNSMPGSVQPPVESVWVYATASNPCCCWCDISTVTRVDSCRSPLPCRLWANMTSYTKPEVHNVSQRRNATRVRPNVAYACCAVKRRYGIDNKVVIDRRLRPRCCHLIQLRQVVPCVRCLQRVFLRAIYSQAQGCVWAAPQLGGDVEQPCLCADMTSSIKPEVRNISLRF